MVGPPAGLLTVTVPSKGLQPPNHPAQAGTAVDAGPARAVVADDDRQHAGLVPQVHPGRRGAAVLDHVGQALGGGEVGGRLHRRRGAPGQAARDGHRDGDIEGQRADRPLQAPVGEHRRLDTLHHRPQVVEGGQRRGPGLGQQFGQQIRVGRPQRLGQPEAHRHRHQPGLRAVVQVALDPPQLGGLDVESAAAGAGQHVHPVGQRLFPRVRAVPHEIGVHAEHERQAQDRPRRPEVPQAGQQPDRPPDPVRAGSYRRFRRLSWGSRSRRPAPWGRTGSAGRTTGPRCAGGVACGPGRNALVRRPRQVRRRPCRAWRPAGPPPR